MGRRSSQRLPSGGSGALRRAAALLLTMAFATYCFTHRPGPGRARLSGRGSSGARESAGGGPVAGEAAGEAAGERARPGGNATIAIRPPVTPGAGSFDPSALADEIERVVMRIQARGLDEAQRVLAADPGGAGADAAIQAATRFVDDETGDREALDRLVERLERPFRRLGVASDEALALMVRARGYRLAAVCRIERQRHLARAIREARPRPGPGSRLAPEAVAGALAAQDYPAECVTWLTHYLNAAQMAIVRASSEPAAWADLLVDLLWDLTVVAASVAYADMQDPRREPWRTMSAHISRFEAWMDGLGGRAGPALGRVVRGFWRLGFMPPAPGERAGGALAGDLAALRALDPALDAALAPLAGRLQDALGAQAQAQARPVAAGSSPGGASAAAPIGRSPPSGGQGRPPAR